jgi:polyhydroxybutyrate depolymerase
MSLISSLAISQQTINASIQHDRMTRNYILYVPAIYDVNTPVALLFNFYEYSRNAKQQLFSGDFRLIANTDDFIIAPPEGTLDGLGITHFNVGWKVEQWMMRVLLPRCWTHWHHSMP